MTKKNRLEIGDTIKCSSDEETIEVKHELEREGYHTDFDYSEGEVRLIVTGIENDCI